MPSVLTPEKVTGFIRRVESVMTTKSFQNAVQNLIDNPDEIEEAQKNPKEYLKGFGVPIADNVNVTLEKVNPFTICLQLGPFSVCYSF